MKKRLSRVSFGALLLLCALLALTCMNPSGGVGDPTTYDGGKPKTNAQQIQMISRLAGYQVDASGPKAPDGTVLPDTYNPLRNAPATVLNKESELFIAGLDGDDGLHNFLTSFPANCIIDGKSSTPLATKWNSTNNEFEWTELYKKSFGADADADGQDELAIVYASLPYVPTGETVSKRDIFFILYDGKPSISTEIAKKKILMVAESDFQKFYHNDDVGVINASLDIDAGRYLGTKEYQFAVSVLGRVILVGGKSQGYAKLKEVTLPESEFQILNLASGDTNGDGTDEILALNGRLGSDRLGTATLIVLNGELAQLHSGIVSTGQVTMNSGSIDAGDSDGDGRDEIVCCGNTGVQRVYTIVLDDMVNNFVCVASADTREGAYFSVGCAALDYNGDGLDEFVGYTTLFDNLRNKTGDDLKVIQASLSGYGMYLDDCIATGQFNKSSGTTIDTCEDVAFLVASGNDVYLHCWSEPNGPMTLTSINTFDEREYKPCLAAVNIDDDSSYVRFTGRELLYTDPHVLAFLSCYPFWEGIDMSGGGNAGSSYSMGTTEGSANDKTVGMSVGLKLAFSVGKEEILKTTVGAEIEGSLDKTNGNEYEQTVTKTFNAGAEDAVIFTSIPYDVYYYEVFSSPLADAVGETIAVSVPRAPIVTKTTVALYNANNGDGQDITTDNLITHTIGNPRSYPNMDFVRARIAEQVNTSDDEDGDMVIYNNDENITPQCGIPAVLVGQGDKETSIELEWGTTKTSTVAWDFSMKVSQETTMAGGHVTLGSSVGFHYGESYTVSKGESTAFSGAIGNLSAENADKRFPFSLFVYKKRLGTTNDMVLVLEYCYEGN